jgi:hypothetical protein
LSTFSKSLSVPKVNVTIAPMVPVGPVVRNGANKAATVSRGLQRWVVLASLLAGAFGSRLAVAQTPPFEPPPAPGAAVSYDGIYQWSTGQYLSLHQDEGNMIATIYFNKDGNFTFYTPDGKAMLPVPQIDIFDLLSGSVSGRTAKISGTRFHRACNVSYDFTFNSDASITATRTAVSNSAAANAAGISCSTTIGGEPITLTVPIIRFNQ